MHARKLPFANYVQIEIHLLNNNKHRIFRFLHLTHSLFYIKYTSKMALWFYAKFNDVIAPDVFINANMDIPVCNHNCPICSILCHI